MNPFKLSLSLLGLLFLVTGCQPFKPVSRQTIDLSGPGWTLWWDAKATWKEDEVFLPPVDLGKLPVHPPTGGWSSLHSPEAIAVSVPGTAEEYLQKISGPTGAMFGVSWWSRSITLPSAQGPRKVFLHLEAARMRVEVFLNQQLVGYDLIGNTPFDIDLSSHLKPGETATLALRITNPDGVFDWRDGWLIPWGSKKVAGSHGFGGISGRVSLISCDPVHINNLWIQNTPLITKVCPVVEVKNETSTAIRRDLTLRIFEKKSGAKTVFTTTQKGVLLQPGDNTFNLSAEVPEAKVWDLDHPELYQCEVSLQEAGLITDSTQESFGFRWFEPAGVGSNARFLLNGRRIVLRSAISWGFWPTNGLYATPELAERQIQCAKDLGLNMLNNHRCIGQPILFEKADTLGLLQFEEPGDYAAGVKDPFAQACIREKLRRMVIRDRSHPSLIIYNLANEMREVSPEMLAEQEKDLLTVHTLDPARIVTRTSGWAPVDKEEDQAKMHLRPNDPEIHRSGWYDYHHAPGPDVWLQSFYLDPEHFYNRTENHREIVFWGEEGAISSPSRLELIQKEVSKLPHLGWDGQMYLDEYKEFDQFLTDKNLRATFPTVDSLTTTLGRISLDHQGRKIQSTRMGDLSDGYVINGWEAEIIENHSGVVDCFRNPKADPSIVAYYNQPLYIPVMPRQQIVKAPGKVLVDFYAINEKNLHGPHTLRVEVTDAAGKSSLKTQLPVTLAGAETYGQLLSAGLSVPIPSPGGLNQIKVTLLDPSGLEVAQGHDSVLGVDYDSDPHSSNGAVWEYGTTIHQFFSQFLKQDHSTAIQDYSENLPPLNWIAVARSPQGGDKMTIPTEYLLEPTGKKHGVKTSFQLGETTDHPNAVRLEPTVDLNVPVGAPPDAAISNTENYAVCWEGNLLPPFTGNYLFEVDAGDKAHLFLDGKEIRLPGKNEQPTPLPLMANKPVTLKLTMAHKHHNAHCRLFWTIPDPAHLDPDKILDRVEKEGTTLILLENSAEWMPLIAKRTSIHYENKFAVGTVWLGGGEFVKNHPLFKDLPVDQGMDWPYQAVVAHGANRFGLLMSGEELVAGAYHCYPNQLGTSVGIINCGKGKIIFSTLNIFNQLISTDSSAEVARKLFCNMLSYSARQKEK